MTAGAPRRLALALIAALLAALAAPQAARQAPAKKPPNVLLILVDDLKPAAGAYGDRLARTPNIDRLAARGLTFDRAFTNQAVCAPSRNALLTGVRPTSSGIYDLGTNFRVANPDAVTLPQLFRQHGYRVEGLGKIFHVGHGNQEDPASWSVPHYPTAVVAYALPESRAPEGLTREEALFSNAGTFAEARRLPRGAAVESADVDDDAYPDGQMAREAIERLRRAKTNPGTPFFLALGFVKPHLPFCAPKRYWDLYDPAAFELAPVRALPDGAPPYAGQNSGELRQYRGVPEDGAIPEDLQRTLIHGYYAATSYADAQIGRVLDELDRLGLAGDTIVVLWGDHGWHLGDHGMWCKHTNYEQAARIPLIVAAPGMKARGERAAALVESVDVYPTLAGLAGLSISKVPQRLDGRSFAPLLDDPAAPGEGAAFHAYPRTVKSRGGALIGRAVRTARHRLVEWKAPGAPASSAEIELYDLIADPHETRNLAGAQPAVVEQLRRRLAEQGEAKPQISK